MGRIPQPSGTVTLVFTDVEGSTRLLAELGEESYLQALSRHRVCIREAFERFGGYEVDSQGDGFFFAFASARDAVPAVIEALACLAAGPIRVRVGMHTGEPILDPPKYVGLDVHKAARIMAVGHGGQVLLSPATRQLVGERFPVRDLGEVRLKDLSLPERIYQLGDGEYPPLRTLERTNLPVPATPFLGRGHELTRIADLLRNGARVVTLTGPGGTGKTRLGLQAAAEVSDAFVDGVWWVPLSSVTDPGLVLAEVAKAVGLGEEPGRDLGETIMAALRGRRLLLLIDNAEHLLPELAGLIGLLRSAEGPAILVTSRERLRIAGEDVFPVPPLDEREGVQLFTARARALDPGFHEVAEVGALCSGLDNLPLAIELAAARSAVLSPAQILERLSKRLDLLTGGRDADPRQQTLRSTIEWSHDLLAPEERALFAALSVFSGGCTLEAAEAVCAADLETLASLVDKSLVRRTGERYWMLATIGEFARERLTDSGDGEVAGERHLAFFLSLAETAALGLRGVDQAEWLVRLDAELDNFRRALDRAESLGATKTGFVIASGLARFWEARGYWAEAIRRFTALLDADTAGPTAERARALFWLGRLSVFTGRWSEGERQLAESASLARGLGAEDTLALALGKGAWAAATLGRQEQAFRFADESLAVARRLGDEWVLSEALNDHAVVPVYAGSFEGVRSSILESLALRRRLGDTQNVIDSINNLGNVAMFEGDLEEAATLFDECIELSRSLGEVRQLVLATANRGQVHLFAGEHRQASLLLEENAGICLKCGDRRIGGATLHALAAIEVVAGNLLRAATLWGAGSELQGHGRDPDTERIWKRWVSQAATGLGQDPFDRAVREGGEMRFEEAVAYARHEGR